MFYLNDTAPNFRFPDDPVKLLIDKIKLLLFIEQGTYPYDPERGIGIRNILFENYDYDELFNLIASNLEPYDIDTIDVSFDEATHLLKIVVQINREQITLQIPV